MLVETLRVDLGTPQGDLGAAPRQACPAGTPCRVSELLPFTTLPLWFHSYLARIPGTNQAHLLIPPMEGTVGL